MRKTLLAVVLIASLLAALAARGAGNVPAAKADAGSTQATCGQNDPSGNSDARPTDVYPSGGNWSVTVQFFCPRGRTFMFEIQRKANSGSNWADVAGAAGAHHWWTSGTDCGNGGCLKTFSVGGGCTTSSYDYRVVVYNDNDRAYGREADYWCA